MKTVDSEKLMEASKSLSEQLTMATGRMSQVRLELDIAKYTGPDVDALLSEMDELQNRACRVAYLAGAVAINVKRRLAMHRLGAPKED